MKEWSFSLVKNYSKPFKPTIFIKLYQSPPKPPIKNPRAYIFQIARNLAIDNVRKRPQFADLESIESIENIVYLPADNFSHKMDIAHAMKTLPLQECQIASLHINGGLKFREIAEEHLKENNLYFKFLFVCVLIY
jgi:DNA-directed RNA polymerase specialized sigma24 family protein